MIFIRKCVDRFVKGTLAFSAGFETKPLWISISLWQDKNYSTFCPKIYWKKQPFIFCHLMNLHVTETPARLIELKIFIIITHWSYETLIGCVCVCVFTPLHRRRFFRLKWCLRHTWLYGSTIWVVGIIIDVTAKFLHLRFWIYHNQCTKNEVFH